MLLESSRYVRCVLIDFSKAFDMVDHVILARKLFHLQVPVFIIQWIMSFLTNRALRTKLCFQVSIRSCLFYFGYLTKHQKLMLQRVFKRPCDSCTHLA